MLLGFRLKGRVGGRESAAGISVDQLGDSGIAWVSMDQLKGWISMDQLDGGGIVWISTDQLSVGWISVDQLERRGRIRLDHHRINLDHHRISNLSVVWINVDQLGRALRARQGHGDRRRRRFGIGVDAVERWRWTNASQRVVVAHGMEAEGGGVEMG